MKQRIVIRARSISIGDNPNATNFPTAEKSLFSDGYDLEGERLRLNGLVQSSDSIDESHPEYQAVTALRDHLSVLKNHIFRNHTNPRYRRRHHAENIRVEDYEIFTSDDENFNSLGRLTDTAQDSVKLHTKQAVRMWSGVNAAKNPYERWPGVRYAMGLFGQMVNAAQNDHPFALASLMVYQNRLNETLAYLEQENATIEQQLKQLNQTGITINVAATPNPTEIPVGTVRGYGFNLLKLLSTYDMHVRLVKTLGLKGLIKNRESNDKIRDAGRFYRVFAQDLYTSMMAIRSAKSALRSEFLAGNDELGEKLKIAVHEGFLELLTEEVLCFKVVPEHAYIQPLYNEEQMNQILEYAHKYNLMKK